MRLCLSCFLILMVPRAAAGNIPGCGPDMDTLPRGEVIDRVVCGRFPDQSYALVLPVGYDPDREWPVVFIFEPAARGPLAARVFLDASRRFGVIVMCSNNSSNRSLEGSFRAAEAMFDDAFRLFSADTSRIILSGFSGGARVASNLALEDPRVDGVIACGAGMYHNRESHPRFRADFCYYGIMGRRDMNLPDMMMTAERFAGLNMPSWFQYTGGRHVWPPTEEIETAVAWTLFMIDSTDARARDFFVNFQETAIGEMEGRGLILDAAMRLESLDRLFPERGSGHRLSLIKGNRRYRQQEKQRERALAREQNLKEIYLGALDDLPYTTAARPDTVHTFRWWSREIDMLKRWEKGKQLENSRMASRVLYLLEVRFSEDMAAYMDTGQHEKAMFLRELWRRISP